MRQFYKLLINTLVAGVTASFLWFALTFWVYLETKNVMATAILGGTYMLLMAITGLWFGTLVDRHKKKQIMVGASIVTSIMYVLAGGIFIMVDKRLLLDIGNVWFWVFSIVILLGALVENIRNIALSTCVTIMVPEKRRANANGLVGMVQGLSFAVTSVFSGLVIGKLGMGWALAIAAVLTIVSLAHLYFVRIDEHGIEHDPNLPRGIDIKGAWQAIRVVPGLLGILLFATFNNLIGGVYMSLLDPYGLTLMSVEAWGILFAVVSFGFMGGGLLVARFGLGKIPLRTLLFVNIGISMVGMFFAIRESVILLGVGMFIYMALIPMAEAAEQMTLQRVVPLKKQGRVFGFGQSLEALAAPISAFMIGPLAQYVVIPYMKTGDGQHTWQWLLGTGPTRGIALVFMGAAIVMLFLTLSAFRMKAFRLLTERYLTTRPQKNEEQGVAAV